VKITRAIPRASAGTRAPVSNGLSAAGDVAAIAVAVPTAAAVTAGVRDSNAAAPAARAMSIVIMPARRAGLSSFPKC